MVISNFKKKIEEMTIYKSLEMSTDDRANKT